MGQVIESGGVAGVKSAIKYVQVFFESCEVPEIMNIYLNKWVCLVFGRKWNGLVRAMYAENHDSMLIMLSMLNCNLNNVFYAVDFSDTGWNYLCVNMNISTHVYI